MTNSEVLQAVLPIYLKRLGMNQTDLAKALGVSRAIVSCWIHGTANPRMKEIEKMARLFGCSTDDLLTTQELKLIDSSTAFHPDVIKMLEDRVAKSLEDTELDRLWGKATPQAKQAALAVLRSLEGSDEK